jgi:hypothetical protein
VTRTVRLGRLLTVACAAVLAGFFWLLGFPWFTEPRLARVDDPARALALIVERTLDLDWALERAPAWERRIYQAALTDGGRDLAQAIEWYAELEAAAADPGVRLRLAMLRAEAGDLDPVRRAVTERRAAGPADVIVDLLEAAYLGDAPSRAWAPELRRALESRLEPGWFRDRLAQRLAERAGDREWLAQTTAEAGARTGALRAIAGAVVALQTALVVAGALAAGALARRRRRRWLGARVADAAIPPPWGLGRGLAVVIRGGAAGAVVTLALFSAARGPVVEVADAVLPALPFLWLASRLARSEATTLAQALGLRPAPGGWALVGLWTGVLVGAGVLLEFVLALGVDAAGVAGHWTEWFDADLAWGRGTEVASSVVSVVVAAPVVEEIGFRGLLFGALRARLGLPAAAAASALAFAALHGYGAAGFLTVLTSGILWAWAFERSGSLLPGIAAHAANNLWASAGVLLLLRA